MNMITNSNKLGTSYEFYIKHNICALEWKLNAMIYEIKNVIGKQDRSKRHLLIRKFSHVAVSNEK